MTLENAYGVTSSAQLASKPPTTAANVFKQALTPHPSSIASLKVTLLAHKYAQMAQFQAMANALKYGAALEFPSMLKCRNAFVAIQL
jgi:hypothetical protein